MMDSYDIATAILVIVALGGLALALIGLLFLSWRVWQHEAAWWRWPALAAVGLGVLGGGISLAQAAAELI